MLNRGAEVMQDNLQMLPTDLVVRKEAYYQIGRGLFYVEELSVDGTMALIEDCYTLETNWVHTAGLEVRHVARKRDRRSQY